MTVYDPSGKIIATSELGESTAAGRVRCTLRFIVHDVPEGHDFYSVEVSHRGKVTIPADQAKAGGVTLTLGA